MSYNQIKKIDTNELPENLSILKMISNPVCVEDPKYRKKIVRKLPQLEELDRLPVEFSERLFYDKKLPNFNIEAHLMRLKEENAEQEMREKIELELYQDSLQEKGIKDPWK